MVNRIVAESWRTGNDLIQTRSHALAGTILSARNLSSAKGENLLLSPSQIVDPQDTSAGQLTSAPQRSGDLPIRALDWL